MSLGTPLPGLAFFFFFFFFFLYMRFVQKYVQDMSNSTRANTRTLPESISIKCFIALLRAQ